MASVVADPSVKLAPEQGSMSKYTLRGVEVEFPYAEAYSCQLAYMEKVIEALQEVRQ